MCNVLRLLFGFFGYKVWHFWWRQVGNHVKATNSFLYSLSLSPRFRFNTLL